MFKKIILSLIALILILGISLFFHVHVSTGLNKSAQIIDIPKGSSVTKISKQLYEEGLIQNKRLFYYWVMFKKVGPKLRAGAFQIPAGTSVSKLIKHLTTQNGAANLVRVVIPEGFSIVDIGDRLQELGLANSSDFQDYAHNKAQAELKGRYSFLKESTVPTIEGYLFPDTYFFSKGTSIRIVVITMLDEFEDKIIPLWKASPKLKDSPKARFNLHQVATIASIIEKEARRGFEMPKISSVFYNRLKKKTVLGSDPTVVYAMGKGYKKRVLYKDTRIDSPYNTYRYTGFPPSPIASFGVAAFKASLAPNKSDYLFFFANSDGTHTFTTNYKEHLRLQRKRKK